MSRLLTDEKLAQIAKYNKISLIDGKVPAGVVAFVASVLQECDRECQERVERILDVTEDLADCADELVVLMDDTREGEYKPDTLTNQPMLLALRRWLKLKKQEGIDE